jgi:hypothetical protein
MSDNSFRCVVIVELPGDVFVNYLVQQDDEEVFINTQVPEGVPVGAPALLLAQILSSVLPAGLASFHAWKAYSVLRSDFQAINDQMANVPAISEDELPF